jgi:hypothetical protein
MLRETPQDLELLALGDSTALVKTRYSEYHRVTDNRIGTVAPELRSEYHQRLAAGCAYDNTHRKLIRTLQEKQVSARNKPGGYWIAEADGNAADESIVRSFEKATVEWCVLATDGAQHLIDYLAISWDLIASMGSSDLGELLGRLWRWEAEDDPSGRILPRAKVHDDKALVTWLPGQGS